MPHTTMRGSVGETRMIKGGVMMIIMKSFASYLISAILVVWMLPFSSIARQSSLDAREMAKEMITIVFPLIQEKNLTIQNTIQENTNLSLEQKERFGELLSNILMNAANASVKKGEIKITYNEPKRLLEVVVSNTETRFNTEHSIKDLRGNTISIESKAGQGVWYRTII